jgi:hypothetical protein
MFLNVVQKKWTDRAKPQHVKCDETRPQCQRCSSKSIACPGYTQRLTWKQTVEGTRKRKKLSVDSHSSSNGSRDKSPLARKHES